MATTTRAGALAHLPVSLFGAVMGIAGSSVAWRIAMDRHSYPVLDMLPGALRWIALAAFAALVVAYGAKAVRHFDAVRAEWSHPVKMAFVPTISIAMLVLARASYGTELVRVGEVLWWAGAVLQLVFTVAIVRAWISRPDFTIAHVHPGWFIPAVGNIVVPLAGVVYARHAEVLWFYFGIGIVYWLALLPMVLSRLVSAEPLPKPMAPTLAILISPPAVGAAAWAAMRGTNPEDAFYWTLLSVAVFQGLLLASQWREIARAPFGPPAWALTFPLAALAAALLSAPQYSDEPFAAWLGIVALVAVTAVVAVVGTRTVAGLVRGTYLVPEPAPAK